MWAPRRFRANILLDGEGEEALPGSSVRLGEAVLEVVGRIQRCVMVTRPQPGGIDRDAGVLRAIARERGACLAVGALVSRPGIVRTGDELHLKLNNEPGSLTADPDRPKTLRGAGRTDAHKGDVSGIR